MKLHVFISSLSIVFLSCKQESPLFQPILPDEYSIYSLVVNQFANSKEYNLIFIDDSTLINYPSMKKVVQGRDTIAIYNDSGPGSHVEHLGNRIKHDWPEFDVEYYQPIIEKVNRFHYLLNIDSIKTSIPIHHRDWSNIRESIYSKQYFDGKIATFWFSRVAFSNDNNEAIVYSNVMLGNSRGGPYWFWLKKHQGKWTIYKFLQTVIF